MIETRLDAGVIHTPTSHIYYTVLPEAYSYSIILESNLQHSAQEQVDVLLSYLVEDGVLIPSEGVKFQMTHISTLGKKEFWHIEKA